MYYSVCFVISISCALVVIVTGNVVDPVFKTVGKPHILVLFDFHTERDVDGRCSGLHPRAVELLWATRWIDSVVQSDPNYKIGLLVYDTCKSERETTQVISKYLNPELCTNNTDIVGIISYTTSSIGDMISSIIKPFGLLHIRVSRDSYITYGSKTTLRLSTVSIWKLQAALTIIKRTGWKSVSSLRLDTEEASTEQMLFENMMKDEGLCIAESNLINGTSLSNSPAGVSVIFATGSNETSTLLNGIEYERNKTYLVVDNINQQNITQVPNSNVLILSEQIPTKGYLVTYMERLLQNVSDIGSIGQEYLERLPFCKTKDIGTPQCRSKMLEFFSYKMQGRDVIAILTAYFNIQRIAKLAKNSNCTDYDFQRCPKPLPFVALSVHQPSNGLPFNVFNLSSGGWKLDEEVSIGIYSNRKRIAQRGDRPELATVYKSNLNVINTDIWYNITKLDTFNSTCTKDSDHMHEETAAHIDGDVYIGGLFPTHEYKSDYARCGKLSWEGIQLTEAFMYAIRTAKERHIGILKNITLGGFVVDSCVKQSDNEVFETVEHACNETITCTEGLEPSKNNTLAMVQFQPDEDTYSYAGMFDSALVQIAPSSIKLNGAKPRIMLSETTAILKALNWTYINVVFSEDLYDTVSIRGKLSLLLKNEICVATQVILRQNDMDTYKSALELFSPNRSTDAVLLITKPSDTHKMITMGRAAPGLNIIVLPLSMVTPMEVVKGMVIIRPTNENDHGFSQYLHSLQIPNNDWNPWLSKFHQHFFKCHFLVDEELIYPDKCTLRTVPRYFSKSLSISRVIKTVDTIALHLDTLYKDLCPEQQGICPGFQHIDIKAKLSGILGEEESSQLLVPDQKKLTFDKSGNAFETMDVLNGRKDSFRKVGAFINKAFTIFKDYVYTYDQAGIPFVTSHVCRGNCSRCQSCLNTDNVLDINYQYKPNDILIAGVFPVSNRGAKPLSCGNFRAESWIFSKAFHFATNTFKLRYPGILPKVTVGSLIFDSCSDDDLITKNVINFETCAGVLTASNILTAPSPAQVYGYVVIEDNPQSSKKVINRLGKQAISVDAILKPTLLDNDSINQVVNTFINVLRKQQFTSAVVLIDSDIFQRVNVSEALSDADICVHHVYELNENTYHGHVVNEVMSSNCSHILMFTKSNTTNLILEKMSDVGDKSLMVANLDESVQAKYPNGTIEIGQDGIINYDFMDYWMEKSNKTVPSSNSSMASLLDSFLETTNLTENDVKVASQLILAVDSMLHNLHQSYVSACPDKSGVCVNIGQLSTTNGSIGDVGFLYQTNTSVSYARGMQPSIGSLGIWRMEDSFNKVGYSIDGNMTLWAEEIMLDIGDNSSLACQQSNFTNFTIDRVPVLVEDDHTHMFFYDTPCVLNVAFWSIGVLVAAMAGALVTMIILVYVLHKVCIGMFIKKYVGLSVMMLIAVFVLYISVGPFLFTPCETVCLGRKLIPNLAYVFVFATLLSKLMALKSYQMAGLGGSIPFVNQLLVVMFVSGVQISTSVHRIFHKESMVIVKDDKFACDFNLNEFLIYLSYNMFILLLCAMYSLTVRGQEKSLGEAKLILIASWLVMGVWGTWITLSFVVPSEYIEPTICAGMLLTSSVIIICVFIPRIYIISNLKQKMEAYGTDNNALTKVDAEFAFERPNSDSLENIKFYPRETMSRPQSGTSLKSRPQSATSIQSSNGSMRSRGSGMDYTLNQIDEICF